MLGSVLTNSNKIENKLERTKSTKMFGSTPVPKLNKLPLNGVDVVVLLTDVKNVASKTSKAAPTRLHAIPLTTQTLSVKKKRLFFVMRC